ncbi:primosomal protein N' [Apilactobacillus ozensis]|uniref:primosomal protein N' n=1 Tax=Apilactobacillus ozensis TaxID=866801 RepID=UPI0023EBBDCC|nr:primosomal protein N' [Apilactobacillus ozensis]MCK8606569.1 primosomal protein N' [Apilactobacillus ozensis]
MKLAEIIVDVPTMQTDKPYTYMIPKDLENQISVGSRVAVPFGRGARKVQGIIVSIVEKFSLPDNFKLKEISKVMDLNAVLNDELLKLSKWLAQTTYSFRINCIDTMLPSAMHAKYKRVVNLIDDNINDAEILQLFKKSKSIDFDDIDSDKHLVNKLMQLKKNNQVSLEYLVNDKAISKKELFIEKNITDEQIKDIIPKLRKNSTNQLRLLKVLLDEKSLNIKQAELTKKYKISNSTINTAIKNQWITKKQVEIYRNPYKRPVTRNYPLKLNDDQLVAVNTVAKSVKKHENKVFLLEGVTGSGKTEVYLQTIQKALVDGRNALMLVPEISLTPQIVNRVKGRFGELVAVLHSGLSKGERYDEWRRIHEGKAQVVVGARSAIFAPLQNIGVIIIDEEHDPSYKQDDNPRYQTREVAKWRAKYNNCPVILGSATPSLESRARASKHVYDLIKLPHRINNQKLPAVSIVDMREELANSGQEDFSAPLINAIKQRILNNEQVVLMLNRRGFSSFVMCRDCGFVLKCPNCDISLTLHMDTFSMKCHYCGHEEAIPKICANCRSRKIRYYGTGTQKAQKELLKLIPEAKVLRMDVDTTRKKGAHEKLLRRFGNHEANILLGTQMIAKGLDFPDVTLVGVLNADTSLDLPDFRASERTFQLLTQVSGRAGRAEKSGQVYIQTFNPDNYAIQLAKSQNYEQFYVKEMGIRHSMNYPPYYFTIKITANGNQEQQVASKILEISRYLKARLNSNAIFLGPSPSSIAKIKNQYYYQIIIKYKNEPKMHECLEFILNYYQKDAQKGLYVNIDSEPLSFM